MLAAGSRISGVAASHELIKNQRLNVRQPPKNRIVRKERSCVRVQGGRGLQRVGCSQSTLRANFRSAGGNFEVRRDPLKVRISREQTEEIVYPCHIIVPIRVDQQFGHRNR